MLLGKKLFPSESSMHLFVLRFDSIMNLVIYLLYTCTAVPIQFKLYLFVLIPCVKSIESLSYQSRSFLLGVVLS